MMGFAVVRDVDGSFRDLRRAVEVCEKDLQRVSVEWCVVVPTALWWTCAALQSPGRVRFAAPGKRIKTEKI